MYHEINVPDCADQLMRLTQIAGYTIAFSLTHDVSIVDGYEWDGAEQLGLGKSLGEKFLALYGGHRLLGAARYHFLRYFEVYNRLEVGKWLWRKYAVIAAPLVRLLVLPLDQKQGIIEAFNHDIDLTGIMRGTDRKVFHMGELDDACKPAMTIVKNLLVSFYEDILVGQDIEPEILEEEFAFDHEEILQSYRRANLRLKVCPGCDGDPPLRTSTKPRPCEADKRENPLWLSANVDHFLPKAKYPFLALHPLNLVPLCLVCNQDRKQENDPFEAVGVVGLDDIYHPYIRGAHGEVQVIVERDPNDHKPHLYFKPANDAPQVHARLNSLEHVLGLQGDWDGDLQDERLDPRIEEALRNATQDERYADDRRSDEWLRTKLRTISNNLEYVIGRSPHTVKTQAYARWLADDEQAGHKRVHLLNQALGIEEGVVNPVQPRPNHHIAAKQKPNSITQGGQSPD